MKKKLFLLCTKRVHVCFGFESCCLNKWIFAWAYTNIKRWRRHFAPLMYGLCRNGLCSLRKGTLDSSLSHLLFLSFFLYLSLALLAIVSHVNFVTPFSAIAIPLWCRRSRHIHVIIQPRHTLPRRRILFFVQHFFSCIFQARLHYTPT